MFDSEVEGSQVAQCAVEEFGEQGSIRRGGLETIGEGVEDFVGEGEVFIPLDEGFKRE